MLTLGVATPIAFFATSVTGSVTDCGASAAPNLESQETVFVADIATCSESQGTSPADELMERARLKPEHKQ